MGQLEDLRIFVGIVNKGGIGRLADVQNIAKSAVSRRLKLMEARYEVQLIDRRPGIWEITEAGQELYQRAMRLIAEADEVEMDFTHARQSLAGPLSVSVPREFGLGFLKPILLDFIEQYPEITLAVDFDDRRVDLERENYDFVIRISEQIETDLICKRLGGSQHCLYASAQYANIRALPENLTDLNQHSLLHYGAARRAEWVFVSDRGKQVVEFQPALNSNSGHFLLEAACRGQGIVRLPDFLAKNAYARGDLQHILPELTLSHWHITLAYSKNRLLNRRMRLFIEEISSACIGL